MTTIINNNFSTVINLSDNDGVRDIAFYAPGDMIINRQEIKKSERIQGIFISDREIERVVEFIFQQQKLLYGEEFYKMYLKEEAKEKSLKQTLYSNDEEYDDPLYNDIVKFVIEIQKASASLIQRRFMIEYNRASKIVDLLEERGIIGPQEGSKPREVLVKQKSKKDE
jgi:S-DNA-T family DNA segregation ATPase FtsK/SpoIIIE